MRDLEDDKFNCLPDLVMLSVMLKDIGDWAMCELVDNMFNCLPDLVSLVNQSISLLK